MELCGDPCKSFIYACLFGSSSLILLILDLLSIFHGSDLTLFPHAFQLEHEGFAEFWYYSNVIVFGVEVLVSFQLMISVNFYTCCNDVSCGINAVINYLKIQAILVALAAVGGVSQGPWYESILTPLLRAAIVAVILGLYFLVMRSTDPIFTDSDSEDESDEEAGLLNR